MEGEGETEVTIVGFRKLDRSAPPAQKAAKWGLEQHLISLVVLDFGGSSRERDALREAEKWGRTRGEEIRVSRVTKQEAFLQTYKEAVRSPLKTFFLTCLSIDQLSKEPMQAYYQQMKGGLQEGLQEVKKNAQLNLQRIGFIILKEKLESLDRRNYFHPNVVLITTELPLLQQLIEEHIKILIQLRPLDSSSSVNSEEAARFGEELEVMGMRLPVYESEKSQAEHADQQALKLLNNTPGVGTYYLQRKP